LIFETRARRSFCRGTQGAAGQGIVNGNSGGNKTDLPHGRMHHVPGPASGTKDEDGCEGCAKPTNESLDEAPHSDGLFPAFTKFFEARKDENTKKAEFQFLSSLSGAFLFS
jgi:hypothetical protein